MSYTTPKKIKDGDWVLPKVGGGYHKSKLGKVIHFKSAESAMRAGRAIMASEHGGFKPTKIRYK